MKKNGVIDLTHGPILKVIFLFAIPVIIGNYLQEMYNTVDTLIVGHTLGVTKLAAVGATSSLVFMVTGFLIGNAGGCAITTSQYYGAQNMDGVKRSVAANFTIAALFSVGFTLVFSMLVMPLLKILNTPSDIIEDTRVYLLIIYLGIPATVLYNTVSSILRSVGDSRTPLYFLIFSSLLNIGLDFLCIIGFKWGVAGAAIATVFSQLVSGVLSFIYTSKKYPELLPQRRHFSGVWSEVRASLKIGVPMGLQVSMVSLGVIVIARVLNGMGSNAVAASSVGLRIQRLIEMVTVSLGTVIGTYVGLNYGARDFARIRSGVKKTWLFCFIYHLTVPLIALSLRGPLVRIFLEADAVEAISYAELHLRCICPFMWILSFLHVYRGAVTGLGMGFASVLGGVAELIMRVTFSLFLAPVIGYAALALTGPAAWFPCAVMMVALFYIRIKKIEGGFMEEVSGSL